MALTDVCVDEKGRSNVQNESEHRFAFYFILLNAQEQKFDDKFLLQIESLTTQGQYPGPSGPGPTGAGAIGAGAKKISWGQKK